MVSQSVINTSRSNQFLQNKVKARLLIVSDDPIHLLALQAELSVEDVEITKASTADEVQKACRGKHDLALIDVGPGKVVDVLDTLRSSEGYADISVLVENSRLVTDPNLAGVLPAYRAMPCSAEELVLLARRYVTPNISGRITHSSGRKKFL